jgi:hypothetical protein
LSEGASGSLALWRIVVDKEANSDVRVKGLHRPSAPSTIARSMSSRDSGPTPGGSLMREASAAILLNGRVEPAQLDPSVGRREAPPDLAARPCGLPGSDDRAEIDHAADALV